MTKRHFNLIDRIANIDNLRLAYKKTAKGKRNTLGYLHFKEYSEVNLILIQDELLSGKYKLGAYREFTIYEPKARQICALDFKDRLVQHAICNIIAPIFEASFLPNSFACRDGLGTHAGIKYIQSKLRKNNYKYFLKTDFSKYFASINRGILHEIINKKIGCNKTLYLLREIIPIDGSGIPIGSLTSQLFANVYGNQIDRFIQIENGQKVWARYMDDIVVLGNNKEYLLSLFEQIRQFSAEKMNLSISKWQVSPTSRGINFLGYRVWRDHKLIRKDSVIRAKRKVKRYLDNGDSESLGKFINSWRGHVKWANCHNLIKHMEKKYEFSFASNH